MDELQKVLKKWLSFFFIENRYQIVKAEVGVSFNDAVIDFSSDRLIWRLVNDRSQILITCRPVKGKYKDWDWYSVDLLLRLIDGKKLNSVVLTEEISQWIKNNLTKIEEKFSADSLNKTKKELAKLEKLRAKEMFG